MVGGCFVFFFFLQAEDGIRDAPVTGVQTCALPICKELAARPAESFFHLLKQNGYHTTSVGKISHLDSQRDLPRSWTEVLNPARSPKLPPQFYRKAPNGKRSPSEPTARSDKIYPDGVLAEPAVSQLRKRTGQQLSPAARPLQPPLPVNPPQQHCDLSAPR